jgi:tetratricopeptide (TPR) repeat protein
MQYYADNDLSKKVISHVTPTYKMIRQGFGLKEEINDFYYSTGLYDYYREAYPEANPRYRTVARLLPKGNKQLGLQELDYSGRNSIFLGAESYSFLYYIYMFYEKNYSTALKYVKILNETYPDNPLYLSARVQILLLLKQYDNASPFMIKLSSYAANNRYFKMLGDVYTGIVEEKRDMNYESSQKFYFEAIAISKEFVNQTNEQISFAYFGLSRIYAMKGDLKKSKEYRKTANSLSSFRDVNFDQ